MSILLSQAKMLSRLDEETVTDACIITSVTKSRLNGLRIKDMAYQFAHTDESKAILCKRKIGRSLAESKKLHRLRYCRMHGNERVLKQRLLTACSAEYKKITNILWKINSRAAKILRNILNYIATPPRKMAGLSVV